MSVDIAELGLMVRSDGVIVADKRLQKLQKAANDSATAADRLALKAERVNKAMRQMGTAMQSYGRNLSLYVSAPMAAFGVASVAAFANFDDAMVKSMSIMGDLSDEMKKSLSDTARDVAKSTAFSAKEAAESYYFLASAGMDAAQSMAALPSVARFAQAGAFDMARATDILTDAQSALGKSFKDPLQNMEAMTALSDVLVKAATLANASVEQFGRALTNKAGTAMRQYNIDVETGVAVLAAWADQGIKAEEAGEKFNIVTRDLQTAIRKNAEEFQKYNVTVYDAEGNFRNMIDIIADLEAALMPMSTEMQALTLAQLGFQDRSVIAIRSLIGLSAKMKEYEAETRKAAGTTDDVANKQMESFKQQMGLLQDEIRDVAIDIGQLLTPSIKSLAETIRDGAQWFSELDDDTKELAVKFGALAAAIGPALIILGGILHLLAPLTKHTKLFAGALTMLVRALWGPAGAILGVIALVEQWRYMDEKIAEAAAESIDKLTASLNRFRSEINSMDVEILTSKINRVNEELEKALEERNRLEASVAAKEREKGESGIGQEDIDEENRKLEEQRKIVEGMLRLRDGLNEQLVERLTYLQSEEGILEEIVVQGKRMADVFNVDEVVTTKQFEEFAEAMDGLEDELNPARKELEKIAKLKAQLDRIWRAGKIGAEQFERWNNALDLREAMLTMEEMDIVVKQNLESNSAWVDEAAAMKDQVDAIEQALDPTIAALADLDAMMQAVNEAFAAGAIEPDQFERVRDAINDARDAIGGMGDAWRNTTQTLANAFSSMSQVFERGTSEQKALALAAAAANTVLAVQAVLNQAQGDPYSAFGRMAAMAAIVAGLGVQVGGILGSGGSSREYGSIAERRQAEIGTGTVLGDMEEKTESIVNATEITADATSELVGINRGMLHALQDVQRGIEGATSEISREYQVHGVPDVGLPNVDMNIFEGLGTIGGAGFGSVLGMIVGGLTGGLYFLFTTLIGNVLGKLLDNLLGGKAKIIDRGVLILAGTLQEAIDGTLIKAFATVKYKRWRFGSTRRREETMDLEDDVSQQLGLIFEAIGDTVMEGALALGLSLEEIEAVFETFTLDEMHISLDDLTGDEIEEQLQAVFGEIFDNLAGAVVPWLTNFQKVGEGLGETLVRVATSVQVFDQVLGGMADMFDPETFAIIAVDMMELAGGIEDFISQFKTFFEKFGPEDMQLEFLEDQLVNALDQVGLTLPKTREEFFLLAHGMDITTEAGREQLATLLRIADVADEYYSMSERAEEARQDQIEETLTMLDEWREAILDFMDVSYAPLVALEDSFTEAMEAAKALNASQKEYAMITRRFNAELRRMAAQLTLNVLGMAETLFGPGAEDTTDGMVDGLDDVREVANQLWEDWMRALERIDEFLNDILLDESLTTLTPQEQLFEAQRQFYRTLADAQAGDVEAAEALPEIAKKYLEEARFMYASGHEYTAIFNAVLAALESIAMPEGIEPTIIEEPDPTEPGWQDQAEYTATALYKQLERFLQASDLARALRDLSQVLGVSVIALAEELKIPLDQLVEILGVELDNLTAGTAEALGGVADMLGADIFELMDALGVDLDALAIAFGVNVEDMSKLLATQLGAFSAALGADVFKLAEALGISIDDLAKTFDLGIEEFTSEQWSSLVEFSDSLGTSLAETTRQLGIDLGEITDATSILSDVFSAEIEKLPDDIQADLGPLLEAIWGATTEADANGAIQDVGNYILSLPEEFRDQLTPFLELIGYEKLMPELRYLSSIDRQMSIANGLLQGILKELGATTKEIKAIKKDAGSYKYPGTKDPISPYKYPKYQSGGYVDETGPAYLHAGEFVVNPHRNNLTAVAPSDRDTQEELKAIRTLLSDIKEQQRRYQDSDLETTREMSSSMKQQAEQTRRANYG